MRTRRLSFRLEEIVLGTFLLQGWLGGILTGFVYVVALCLWDPKIELTVALTVSIYFIILGSILGVIKSIIMWAVFHLPRFRVRAETRITLTTLATGVFALSVALLADTSRPSDIAAWVAILVVGGLPTAILVGSNVKPWDLFTFGSIDGQRVRSIWRTLATLPLRFVSLLTLGLWVLYVACNTKTDKLFFEVFLIFIVVAAYLLYTAYITFRSPHKVILLIAGLGVNVPLAYIGVFVYQTDSTWSNQGLVYVATICASLLSSWVIFLIARLSVRTSGGEQNENRNYRRNRFRRLSFS